VLRHRSELVMAASQHVQHMHKALTQMNPQIHHVISDITGMTGLAIVDAILAGQRDAAELAKLRDPHIKAHAETIRKSLVGNWRSEHLFTLKQSRELHRTCQQLIVGCDLEIEKMLLTFEARTDPVERPLLSDRKRNRAGKKSELPARSHRTQGCIANSFSATEFLGRIWVPSSDIGLCA
jgi:transposase